MFAFTGPPSSVDRLSEVDDEVDVDVEECSDSEEASRSGRDGRRTHSRATATPNSVSDEERLTPEPASVSAKKVRGFGNLLKCYISGVA